METTTPTHQSVVGLPIGPELLHRLQTVPPATVNDTELIDRIIAAQKVKNNTDACLIRDQAELGRRRLDCLDYSPTRPLIQQISEFAHDEIANDLHLSNGTAKGRFHLAVILDDQLPCLVEALQAGVIDYATRPARSHASSPR